MEETKENVLKVHNTFLNQKIVITDYNGKKFTGKYKHYCDNDYNDKVEFVLSLDKYSVIGVPVEDVKTIELAEDD